jgi:hypothetical protein
MRALPLRGFLRRKFEAALVRIAAWILIGRNVHRAGVTSRRDNDAMWGMAERLEQVAKRISSNYRKGMEGYDK